MVLAGSLHIKVSRPFKSGRSVFVSPQRKLVSWFDFVGLIVNNGVVRANLSGEDSDGEFRIVSIVKWLSWVHSDKIGHKGYDIRHLNFHGIKFLFTSFFLLDLMTKLKLLCLLAQAMNLQSGILIHN